MRPCSPIRAFGLTIAIFLASWAMGCDSQADKKQSTNSKPSTTPNLMEALQAPATVVEMSDLKITMMMAGVGRFEVKYLFTKSQPQPGHKYMCHVKIKDVESYANQLFDGKDLRQEGTFQGDVILLKPEEKALVIWMGEDVKGDHHFQRISNVMEGVIPGR